MSARRKRALRQLPTFQECEERADLLQQPPHPRWLTPRRAAVLEAVLVSLAFLLCVWVLAH